MDKLKEFLNKFHDERTENENSYLNTLYLPTNDPNTNKEIDFEIELEEVMKQMNIKQYIFQYCGEFDSPRL